MAGCQGFLHLDVEPFEIGYVLVTCSLRRHCRGKTLDGRPEPLGVAQVANGKLGHGQGPIGAADEHVVRFKPAKDLSNRRGADAMLLAETANAQRLTGRVLAADQRASYRAIDALMRGFLRQFACHAAASPR